MFSGSNNLSKYNRRNLVIWMTLAFQAGAINAGGFIACHKFVSHTTGFATLFGTELAQGQISHSLGMLTVPLFFVMGVMTSAFYIDHQVAVGKQARYDLMIGLICFFMLTVTGLGSAGVFGTFGEAYAGIRDYSLLAILCLACGIQNASITSASGAVVRTTHLTGITTDLGIGLVRVLSSGFSKTTKENEWHANIMRLSLILFFIIGSTFSSFIYYQVHYWGFLLPALTSLAILSYGYFSSYKKALK